MKPLRAAAFLALTLVVAGCATPAESPPGDGEVEAAAVEDPTTVEPTPEPTPTSPTPATAPPPEPTPPAAEPTPEPTPEPPATPRLVLVEGDFTADAGVGGPCPPSAEAPSLAGSCATTVNATSAVLPVPEAPRAATVTATWTAAGSTDATLVVRILSDDSELARAVGMSPLTFDIPAEALSVGEWRGLAEPDVGGAYKDAAIHFVLTLTY